MILFTVFVVIALAKSGIDGALAKYGADGTFEDGLELQDSPLLASMDPEIHMSTPQIVRRWG